MKKFLVFFIFTQSLFSQDIIIKGVVKDSITPLSFTNIIAKPTSSLVNLSFSITDEQGRYKLRLKRNEEYTITASFLGYESLSLKLTAIQNATKNFILKQSAEQLNEVVIVQELPVEVKEDTITFNTKAFVTGEERKLKNILKKLPGVEVDKEGGVLVNGKKITKMLVENKKFFGGSNTRLAVENIPADAVDKIEVIDNYNEVTFLKEVSDSDELAMNIKLKKDKKKFAFGDVDAGKGNKNHYVVHTSLFYYSPKTNINFIGDMNNIGKKFFTFKDYLSFENAMSKVLRGDGSIFNTSNNNFSSFLESKDFYKNENKFGALNLTKTVTDKLEISGYTIFSNTKTTTKKEIFNQYLFNENSFNEGIANKGDENNLLGIGKFSIDYSPNKLEQVYINTQVKYSNNKNDYGIISTIDDNEQHVFTKNKLNGFSINQDVEWHKKINKKQTASFGFNYNYNKNNPTNNWLTNRPIFEGLIPLIDVEEYDIHQTKRTETNYIDAVVKHFLGLTNTSQLNTTIGNHFLYEKYLTSENQMVNNEINDFGSSGFGNNLNFKLNDLFVGLHYKFKKGKTTLKAGVFGHSYHWKSQQAEDIKTEKLVLLPDLLLKYSFNKSEHLNFKYQIKSTFSSAYKYADKYSLLDYRTVIKGNPNLENTLYYSTRLWYTKFSMYNNIVMSGSIAYHKKVNSVKNEIQTVENDKYLLPVILDKPETSWISYIDVYKKIRKIKIRVKGNLNILHHKQIVNNELIGSENILKRIEFSLSTLFKNYPNLDVGLKNTFSDYKLGSQNNKFETKTPFINIDYDFLNGFIFNGDYSKIFYKDKNLSQNIDYDVANLSLFYQKGDSPFGFEFRLNNVLDTKYKINNSFTEYKLSESKTYILPRVYAFTVSYKL